MHDISSGSGSRDRLPVEIGSVRLPNPVCVASGTFGYGSEYEELIDLAQIGALFAKSVTIEPRPGNDIPRLIETPSGLLNSIGLANVGIDRYVSEKLPQFEAMPCPVFANVAGGTEDEYASIVARLDTHSGIAGYELNLSCPNVRHGLAFGTEPAQVESLTARVRTITERPVVVKLTPNVTDIAEIARAAEAGGADAVTCVNTLVGMVIDTGTQRPVLPAGTGGLSGPAMRPVGVAAVYRVSRAIGIPVFGVGGIMAANDAIEYLLAGAHAVQIGTANFVEPRTVSRVLAGILDYAEEHGLDSVAAFGESLKA